MCISLMLSDIGHHFLGLQACIYYHTGRISLILTMLTWLNLGPSFPNGDFDDETARS